MIHSQLWRIRSYLFAFEALCEGTDGTAALLPLGAHIWHVCSVEVHCTLELEVLPVLHDVVNERLAAGKRVAYDVVDLREVGSGPVSRAAATSREGDSNAANLDDLVQLDREIVLIGSARRVRDDARPDGHRRHE